MCSREWRTGQSQGSCAALRLNTQTTTPAAAALQKRTQEQRRCGNGETPQDQRLHCTVLCGPGLTLRERFLNLGRGQRARKNGQSYSPLLVIFSLRGRKCGGWGRFCEKESTRESKQDRDTGGREETRREAGSAEEETQIHWLLCFH